MSLLALSLFNYLRLQDQLTWKIRPRVSPRVINYYPRYLDSPKSLGYSDYYRVKLMLHHLFTDWPDLLLVENETYGSYIKAFQACKRLHTHPEDFYTDLEGEGSDLDSNLDDKDLQEDKYPLTNFKAFAR